MTKEAADSATKLQSRFRGYKLRKDALIIRVEKLSVVDLFDTGSFLNGQDPALSIKIGKKVFSTKRVKDAGTKAVFPEAFTFTVEAADLNANIEVSRLSFSFYTSTELMLRIAIRCLSFPVVSL